MWGSKRRVYLGCTSAGSKGGVRDVDVQAQVNGATAHSVLDLIRHPVEAVVVQLRAEHGFHALSGTCSTEVSRGARVRGVRGEFRLGYVYTYNSQHISCTSSIIAEGGGYGENQRSDSLIHRKSGKWGILFFRWWSWWCTRRNKRFLVFGWLSLA